MGTAKPEDIKSIILSQGKDILIYQN